MNSPSAVSIQECAELLASSGKHVYTLIDTDPTIPKPSKLGGCTRIELAALRGWIAEKSQRAKEAWEKAHA